MWQEPKTDWQASDNMTAEEWNRIVDNVHYLQGDSNRSNYTSDDFIKLVDFQKIKDAVNKLAEFYLNDDVRVDDECIWSNINTIESLSLKLKPIMDRSFEMKRANHYAGRHFTNQINVGGHI